MEDIHPKKLCQAVLKDLVLNLHIGIASHEQGLTQPVLVNAKVHFLAQSHLSGVKIADVYDYSSLYNYLKSLEKNSHIDMLEGLMWNIFGFIFSDHKVVSADLSFLKTTVLSGVEAGIEISMTKLEWQEQNNWLGVKNMQELGL